MRHQLLTIGIASFTYLWSSVRPCDSLKALSLLNGNRLSPIYTAYDHPPLCQSFGIRGDYNLQLVSNGFLGANPALIRDSNPPSTLFSGISDITLPTRLGLRPIALHTLPLFTSAILHLFVRPVIPLSAEHGHGPSRSLSRLWVNPFSRWAVRLYCHNQLCVPTC